MGDACAILGRVEDASGQPLRKAEVTASNHEKNLHYIATTGADGIFRFDTLVPGQYRLQARRAGYVPAVYGSRDEMSGGTPLTAAPGREIEVLFSLAPQAVLTGRALDEDGDPLEGILLTLLREADFGHGIQIVPRNGSPSASDDEGNFRIAGIAAGSYFLCASYQGIRHQPPGQCIQSGPEEAYPDLYYPDVLDLDEAQPIPVAAAARLSGFELRLKKARAYHVRGRVELPADANPRSLFIHLDTRMRIGLGMGGRRMAHGGGENFDIAGVLPGAYTLRTACNEACVSRQAQMDVDVTDHDVDGLVLRFPEGGEVRGILRGMDPPPGTQVGLASRGPRVQNAGAPVARDGTFTLQHVEPEVYRVQVWPVPRGSYVKAVRYGGIVVPAASVEMPKGDGVLEVEIASDGATISGTVGNASENPLAGGVVWLWTQSDRGMPAYTAVADQDGRFEIRGIAPGNYRIEAGASMKDRPTAPEGTPLSLSAGEHRSFTLRANAIQ